MTKRFRTFLFSLLLAIFLVAAPLTIFYSFGYRFDLASRKITKTGTFYFKVLPRGAQIYINGKLTKKTDFLLNAAAVENLLPKKYLVQIKKDGFNTWEKNLEIQETSVTRAESIVLFPNQSNFVPLLQNIEDFFYSPDEKMLILKETASSTWALKIFEIQNSVKSHLANEKDFSKSGADLQTLDFTPDSKTVNLGLIINEDLKNYTINLNNLPTTPQKALAEKVPAAVVAYQKVNNEIYYLDNQGFFYKADANFSPKQKMNETALPLKEEVEHKVRVFQNNYFIQEEANLYLFNPDLKLFEKFADNIQDVKISPDLKKLVYFTPWEISVYYMQDKTDQPFKNKGDESFLIRYSEKIGDVWWLNNNYLIFNVQNKIKIAETDDRDKINVVDLAEFGNPKLFWSKNYKKLFLLSSNTLYSLGDLLP